MGTLLRDTIAVSPLTGSSIAEPIGYLSSDVLLNMQAAQPARYPVLLESAAATLQGDNYDILMAFPGDALALHADQDLQVPTGLHPPTSGFLSTLDHWWRSTGPAVATHTLPFQGGWFVYLSYELAAEIEPSLNLQARGLVAKAVRIPAAIMRHSVTGAAWCVVESDAEHLLGELQRDCTQAQASPPIAAQASVGTLLEEAPQRYLDAVEAALQHIAAGNIYQCNLSRGWQATLNGCTPQMLYQALRAANPGPYSGLALLTENHAVISSSPERLIEIRDGWASTRPIAGTRPRHREPQADQALSAELQAHPKERAEHIMLLDLERNDLGRICVGGSVSVNEYMSLESYAHVHHIVSNVRGRLRSDVTPGAAIAAVFPGGTITGCPKVRCMEIIADLEHTARGAYTGSMGYLNRDGSMDLNILIRTLEVQGDSLTFRAGAGIVADSIAAQELAETRAKALGMLRALQSE